MGPSSNTAIWAQYGNVWGTSDYSATIVKALLNGGVLPLSSTGIYSLITAGPVQVPGLAGNPVGTSSFCG